MKRLSPRSLPILLFALLFTALALSLYPSLQSNDARPQVQVAWQNARAAGGYSFRSTIQQSDIPVAKPSSVGHTSVEHSYYFEGYTHLNDKKLELTLWDNGGSVAQSSTGAKIKIENGKAYGRRGEQAWQEIGNFTDSIAPEGDFMAFLAGAQNVRLAGHETRNGVAFARYTFEINGVGFAEYIRDQMQTRLREQGELPYGLQIGLAEQYKNLKGTGELWVRADGLPLRQISNLEFAPQNDAFTRATITTDFFDFPNYAQFQDHKNFWTLAVENFPHDRVENFGAYANELAAAFLANITPPSNISFNKIRSPFSRFSFSRFSSISFSVSIARALRTTRS